MWFGGHNFSAYMMFLCNLGLYMDDSCYLRLGVRQNSLCVGIPEACLSGKETYHEPYCVRWQTFNAEKGALPKTQNTVIPYPNYA
jgi:hypothetical protein